MVDDLTFAAGVSLGSSLLCIVYTVHMLRALHRALSFCVLDQSVGVQVSEIFLIVMRPQIFWSYDKFAIYIYIYIHTHTHIHAHTYNTRARARAHANAHTHE